MALTETLTTANTKRLYRFAFGLAVFTIIYNIAEGIIATYFGYEDESLTLFGFGVDSFIEAVSGFGIAHMVLRIQHNAGSNRSESEQTALRITGYAFYVLTTGLVITTVYNLWTGHQPATTLWGVIISLISIIIMLALVYAKTKTGKQLNSDAILADAQCTRVCIYMSVVLLAASGIYELANIPYIDSIGALGLAWFSYREGKECFEKAESNKNCSCDHN